MAPLPIRLVPRRLGQALNRPQIPEPTEADEAAGEPEQRAVDVGAPLIADQEASNLFRNEF
jgi:hypothetical protein